MSEFEQYVQRYISNKSITAEEAKKEAIIDSVRIHYENGDNDYNAWGNI